MFEVTIDVCACAGAVYLPVRAIALAVATIARSLGARLSTTTAMVAMGVCVHTSSGAIRGPRGTALSVIDAMSTNALLSSVAGNATVTAIDGGTLGVDTGITTEDLAR